MKKRYPIAFVWGVTVSGFMLVSAGPSHAAPCKPIEFAELQSLNKKELITVFCSAKKDAEFNLKLFEMSVKAQRDLLAQNSPQGLAAMKVERGNGAIHSSDQDSCQAEMSRIERVLAKKGMKNPSCQ